MRTLGIDLSADRSTTAMAVIDWSAGTASVLTPATRCGDEELLQALTGLAPGDRAGIDTPFGWPAEFVRAISAHLVADLWPGRGQDSERYRKDHLRYRLTDRIVWSQIQPATPLAAPFNLIGAMVARWAHLEDELTARGLSVDRSGVGPICEVYPKASRLRWHLEGTRSMERLLAAAPWLRCDPHTRSAYDASDDAYDALVCALTARAAALDLTTRPTAHEREQARLEGWIHLPTRGSLPLLPQRSPTA